MKIIDIEGHPITVTDLNAAISQVKLFKDLRHIDPEFKGLDERLKTYWTDIYNKLIDLKKEAKK